VLTFVYDGTYKTASPIVTGVVPGDDAIVTVTGGGTHPDTYPLSVSVGNPDYRLADGEDGKAELVIEKASVTVGFDTLTFVYDGKEHAPAPYAASGLVGSDTVSFTTNANGGVNVGTYNVTVSLDDDRYVLVNDVSSEFTVTPAPVSVLWSNNGTPTARFIDVNGESVELAVKYYSVVNGVREQLDFAPAEPGRYVAVASVSEYTDYSFSATEYEFVIEEEASKMPPEENDTKGDAQV
jgi:hypothetical protein